MPVLVCCRLRVLEHVEKIGNVPIWPFIDLQRKGPPVNGDPGYLNRDTWQSVIELPFQKQVVPAVYASYRFSLELTPNFYSSNLENHLDIVGKPDIPGNHCPCTSTPPRRFRVAHWA